MSVRVRVEPPLAAPFERALDADEIIIGRSPDAGLVVHDVSVSRQHARLFVHDGRWWVEDLKTRNGTRLNGKTIDGPVALAAGDRFKLGGTMVRFLPADEGKSDALAIDRQAARFETLNEIHRALATPISLSELLDLILARCFDVLHPEEGLILLKAADGTFTRAASRRLPGTTGEVFISRRIVDEVATKGKSALVSDAAVDERFSGSESIMLSDVRQVLAAPLIDADGTIGMIALCSSAKGRRFAQPDLDLLESLASAAALRVRNVALAEEAAARRVLERELALAHDMQMSMLPRHMPDRSEIELAATLHPARSVGGDLYDFVLHGDRLWFIVADVSGKGVAAALYMAVAKTLFRATVQGDVELPDVLARMNRELCRDNDQMIFVTALAGHLTLRTGEVALGDAGHNPAVVIARDGRTSAPDVPKCIALGVIEDAEFAQSTFRLDRGATLLLYTDGATDARDPAGEIFGSDRLDLAIATFAGRAPQPLVDGIIGTVDAFAASAPPEDDLTLLALRYVGLD